MKYFDHIAIVIYSTSVTILSNTMTYKKTHLHIKNEPTLQLKVGTKQWEISPWHPYWTTWQTPFSVIMPWISNYIPHRVPADNIHWYLSSISPGGHLRHLITQDLGKSQTLRFWFISLKNSTCGSAAVLLKRPPKFQSDWKIPKKTLRLLRLCKIWWQDIKRHPWNLKMTSSGQFKWDETPIIH